MSYLECQYLHGQVELTDERIDHIAQMHPDLLPMYFSEIRETLTDPDEVRRSARIGNARVFYRFFCGVRGGKHVAVVVVSDSEPSPRHWVITAYVTRRVANGVVEWRKG